MSKSCPSLRSFSLSVTAIATIGLSGNTQQPLTFGAPAVAKTDPAILWTPPKKLGTPKTTSAGGTRGQVQSACELGPSSPPATIALLVPSTRTDLLTASAHPTLAWYVETTQTVSMKFLLTDPNQAEPVFSQVWQTQQSGIVQVTLPAHVALKPGIKYRWTVLTTCGDRTIQEVHARSFIERIDNATLPQLMAASELETAAFYAKNGIWYDALNTLLTAQPTNDPAIKSALKSLLTQAGSPLVAESAIKLARN